MLLSEASFVVVDCETTGLSPAQNRMTELALVRFEGGAITDTLHSLINPEQFIPSYITQMTGITNAMIYGQPRFAEFLPQVKEFLTKRSDRFVLAGHNVKFDHGFLAASFQRAGEQLTLPNASGSEHLLCTCRLARRFLPKLRSKSLSSVQGYFGIPNPRQHRAHTDAEATAKILGHFLEMAQELEIESLADLLHFQYARSNNGQRTKRQASLREKVRGFPERPGVYIMTNASGDTLYVGKAKNLRDRVSTYFLKSSTEGTKLTQLMRTVKEIRYEETGSELSALLVESQRIKELSPRFNAVDRFYRSQAFVRLDVQNPFPTLVVVREPGGDGAEYFGPFKWPSGAEALVDILNRSFKLRECGDQFRVGPGQTPCLYYDMKRCNAPCAMIETKEQYRQEVDRLRAFLAAGDEGVLSHVEAMMIEAADRLDFEEAQFLKIRLEELRRVLGSGDRPDASLSSNDFVVLNPTPNGSCEVLFVRFGRLVKQRVIDRSFIEQSEAWFLRQLRLYYGPTPALSLAAGKPEIDEMCILTRWVDQHREKCQIVYVSDDWDAAAQKLVTSIRELFPLPEALTATPARAAPRERKLSLRPMKQT